MEPVDRFPQANHGSAHENALDPRHRVPLEHDGVPLASVVEDRLPQLARLRDHPVKTQLGSVEWIHREARGWVTTPVPALEDLPAETALVIEW